MHFLFVINDCLRRVGKILLGVGAVIVLCQIIWISYGVFMRYVLNSPDRYATEATALLLFPLAFLGLVFASQDNALPRVSMLLEMLPGNFRRVVELINHTIITFVGAFFCAAATRASVYTYFSGASSEILEWPKVYLWIPVAVSFAIFTADSALRTIILILSDRTED
jgi:TRAP-type C4-dicarboxylate transport system permease small subunit